MDLNVESVVNPNGNTRTVNPIPTVGVSFHDASAMMEEIQAGREVHVFWPGSGPMVDPAEKAALVDFYRQLDISLWFGLRASGSDISVEVYNTHNTYTHILCCYISFAV